jgi:hypothetical protein
MNPNTAAYASAPLRKASLRLRRLRGRLGFGGAKPEDLNLGVDKTT